MAPEVSIITPAYNSGRFVALTIASVLEQTYENWELLLVDDCSTDNTLNIIEPFLKDYRIKLLTNKSNQGVAYSRNLAIKEAKGRFIAFLDSDDMWATDKLQKQISFMKLNNYALTHTSYRKINLRNELISNALPVSKKVSYSQLIKHNEMGCLTCVYDSHRIGKFYFIKVGHEDFVYWLAILKQGICSYGLNIPLAYYRVHKNTISSNKFKAAKFTWSIYRNIEKFGFLKSLYIFSHYTCRSLFKFIN